MDIILSLQLIDVAFLEDLLLFISIVFIYYSVLDLLWEDKNACKEHT